MAQHRAEESSFCTKYQAFFPGKNLRANRSQRSDFHPKALKGVKGSVGAPMPGEVLDIKVKEGDVVKKGEQLAILSGMKMEMVVQCPSAITAEKGMKLQGDDLQVTVE